MLSKRISCLLITLLLPLWMMFGILTVLHAQPTQAARTTVLFVDTLVDEYDDCNSGSCSLREAIAAAEPGDTIAFDVSGTIIISNFGELVINKNLTISSSHPITVSGGKRTRVFNVLNGDVTFHGLRIIDGHVQTNDCGSLAFVHCGGGIMIQAAGSVVTVSNSSLSGNSAQKGGGIYTDHGYLHIISSTFSNNVTYEDQLPASPSSGAAIHNFAGLLAIDSSHFFSNTSADFGGAIFNSGTLSLANSTLSGNAADRGGGITNLDGALALSDSAILGNSARQGGGVYNKGAATVAGSTFSGNMATDRGGGIENLSSATAILAISNSHFFTNSATNNGSAIHNFGTVTISSSSVVSNTAGGTGGIYNFAGSVTVSSSTLSDNAGGGIGNAHQGEVTINNCTLANNSGGGIYNEDSEMTVNESDISGNLANNGSGIYNEGILTLNNSHVTDNAAADSGGAIYSRDRLFVNDSIIVSNTAVATGGGIVNGRTMVVKGSLISGNVAPVGAGVHNSRQATLSIDDTDLAANSATFGGAVFNEGTLTVADSTLSGNAAAASGGALSNRDTMTVSHSLILDNNAGSSGGGLHNAVGDEAAAEMNIMRTTIVSNTASSGGGIFNEFSLVTVSHSTLSNNSAGSGGGIYNHRGGTTVDSSTLLANMATASGQQTAGGGALHNWEGTLTVSNSTLSGNTTAYQGGGIRNHTSLYGKTMTVNNSTLSGNSAANGGGLFNEGANFYLLNTILANSSAGQADCTSLVALTSDVNNLIENNDGCGTPVATADPQLGPLADNGGDTWTHELLPASPALDSGDNDTCLPTDQRGILRPQTAVCDIGSFERAQLALTVILAGDGLGTVTSVPAGIDCEPDCSQTYDFITAVTLTAAAETGHAFTGWSGDCTGTAVCVVLMNTSRSVSASFAAGDVGYQRFLPAVLKP